MCIFNGVYFIHWIMGSSTYTDMDGSIYAAIHACVCIAAHEFCHHNWAQDYLLWFINLQKLSVWVQQNYD